MSSDIEDTLCNFLRTASFALQLDESTLPGNELLLLAYVRFIKDKRLTQELLFAKELLIHTKGESIFRAVEEFFKEKNILLTNIMTVGTDGAPSMVGSYRGFIAHLKEVVPTVNGSLRDSLAAFGCKTPQRLIELLTAVCHCSSEQNQE